MSYLFVMLLVGCAAPQQQTKFQSNATVQWVSGLNERVYIAPTKKTVSAKVHDKLYVFSLDEKTSGMKCVVYEYGKIAAMEVCGSEITITNSDGIATDVGHLIMDDDAQHISFEVDEAIIAQEEERKRSKAIELAEQEQLEQWALKQTKRRIEAETREIETRSSKAAESIDASNDALRDFGEGVKNHGVR
ncbi:hypothetical protein ACQ895_04280 [Vibrio parahaemolyticus]|uniref:hypothetical protein n=1 Tax=Vibrio parahaemolyticus TaxID=670 RepID=UPI00387AC4B2